MGNLKEMPECDRPREKFMEKGPDALTETELLAILLGSGIPGKNVKKLSEEIVRRFRRNFLELTVRDLMEVPGIGQAKALQIVAAIALVKRFTGSLTQPEKLIVSLEDVRSITEELGYKKREYLVCLYLNARNGLIKKEIVSIGTLTQSLVHPREVFGPALELRAANIVLVHNHPSGNANPSSADIEVVNKLVRSGKLLGINVVDFVILAGRDVYSFFNGRPDEGGVCDYVADGDVVPLYDRLQEQSEIYGNGLSGLMTYPLR